MGLGNQSESWKIQYPELKIYLFTLSSSQKKGTGISLRGAPVNHQSCRYLSLGYEKDKIRVQTAFCSYFYFLRNFYNLLVEEGHILRSFN